MSRTIFFLFLNFLFFGNYFATHLVGGNLAYEFVGVQPNGDFRYILKLNYYFDCGSNSNWQPPGIPTNMSVAVYAHDDPADIFPTNAGNYPKYGSTDVDMVYSSTVQEYFEINPNNPSGCNVGTNTCVYTVLYTGQIDLAPNNPSTGQPVIGGYFLIHEACCRNGGGNGIDNIQNPGSAGMAFYAYIPPYGFENNSPIFTDNPVPFICAGDTTTFLNTAIDPDGDELLFSFTAPLDGNHSGGFGGSNNVNTPGAGAGPGGSLTWYPDTYPWPIEEVTYAGGYSYQQPFGPTGYYYISASNGLTKYKSNNQGKFVVGLMIKEYRNGVLIGISTREVQLNVIACLPNIAPNINPSAGSTNTIFSVEEGGNLSFNFGFFDPDTPADSLNLTVSGQIFDSTFTSPEAQVGGYYDTLYSDPINGIDTVGSTFTWNTDCGQAKALPYFFSASVSDRGCPPKTTSIVYEVTVNKTNPPVNIYGSLTDCQNAEAVYTTDDNPNISGYTWDVSANGIITQNYGDSAKILWIAPGTGSVFLKAVNQFGCESDPIQITTTITPAPTVDAGNDVNICSGDSVLLNGTTTSLPGYISLWQPNTNVSSPTNMSTWVNPTVTTSYYLLVQRGASCIGGDSVKVTVDIGNIDAGNDITICFGDTVSLNATGIGSNFSWSPNSNISQINSASTEVWPDVTSQYNVQFTTNNNCQAEDSVVVFVNPIPGSNPDFVLNASATNLGNDEYRLTDMLNFDTGAIWNSTLVNLNQPFHFDVDLYFGINDINGADGIAFGLQQLSNQQLGSGAGIGYAGITPSIFIEFDTYQNGSLGDISDDHVAVQLNGSIDHNSPNSIVSPISLGTGNIEDGLWHNCIFDWNPVNQLLTVKFDGVQIINLSYDIVNNIFSGSPATFWGFTASTGGSNNEQKVKYNNGTFFNKIIDQEICSTDSLLLSSPVIADIYSWTPNVFINDSSVNTPTFYPSVNTTYIFTGTNNFGCFIKDTFQIVVNDLPTVNAGIDQIVCAGDSVILNGNGNAQSFDWDNSIIDGQIFEVINTQSYLLTGTSTNGCINTDTVIVNALLLPSTDAGNDINLCINDSVQLQATGADNYLWFPNPSLSDLNISNPWAVPTVNTTYILTGSLANGCTKNDTISIDINPLPLLTTSIDATICEGDTISIEVFGGSSCTWLTANNLSNSTVSNPQVWPTITTTYQVLASDSNTCADTAEITITVNPKPTVNAGLDQNICKGDTAQISISGAINYQWSPDINISIINSSSLNVWPEDTTSYIVTGIDANFCINKDTIEINILKLPLADAGEDLWVCPGSSLTLSATGGITYNWFPDSTLNSSVGTPIATPFDDETYVVEVIDSNNCINYDTIFLRVESDVPTDAGGDTLTICGFTNVVLGGNPTAPAGSIYTWSSNSNITNPTNSNPTSEPTAASWYTVETANDTCTGIDSVFVDFFSEVIGNSSVDTSICFGESITLSVSGGNSYQWSPITNLLGDTILSNEYSANPIASPNETTIFEVSIFDTNGCYIIDTTIINIKDLPNFDLGSDLFYCVNDSIELSSPVDQNYIYSWSPNYAISNINIYNPFVYSMTDTNYILTLTDTLNCTSYDTIGVRINSLPNVSISGIDSLCYGDSTILNASGSALVTSYNWAPNTNLSNNSIFNPTAFPNSSSYYFVTATDVNGCSNMDSLFITVLSLPVADAGEDTATCLGISIQLNGSGGSVPEWINTITLSDSNIYNPISYPISSTNYILKVTDTYGCVDFDTILVDVFTNVMADAGPDIDTCANVPVLLQASGGVSYVWLDSLYINRPYVASPLAFPTDDIEFIVEVTDSNGCVDFDSVKVFIFLANTSNDTVICNGDYYQANIYGDSPSAVFWMPVDGVSNPNIGNPILSPSETTTYLVNIIDGARCVVIDTVKIEVPVVEATFDTVVEPGCNGIEVTYYNTSHQELDFYWIFSDTDSSSNNEIVKTFSFESDYFGSLFVKDTNGCVESLTYNGIELNFDDWLGEVRKPNVFTPNGDNMNDEFTIEIPEKVEKCAELTIYNRWGQIIYFSTGNNLKWDGKNSVGSETPTGTYFYTLTIKDQKFEGSLNLMR